MNVTSAAITDIGRVRQQNEDRFVRLPEASFFGVADGIGGLPHGATAAQCTIDWLTEAFDPAVIASAADLAPLVTGVNQRVAALGAELSPAYGLGTTLTVGTVRGDRLWLAHVGDSRCLLIRGRETILLTSDHTVINEARRRRAAGEDYVVAERYRNALTQCIGQPGAVTVDVIEHRLAPGDIVLFATDGVTKTQSAVEIGETMRGPGSLEQRLAKMIDVIVGRGAPDNATAVAIEIAS